MLPVAELVLRWAIPDVEIRTPLARGGFVRPYVPDAEADLVGADFRVRYSINECGFRDVRGRAIARGTTDESHARSLLLGDSFTEGLRRRAGRHVRARLAQRDYEVWNLGRMGASPLFYVVMAREFVPLPASATSWWCSCSTTISTRIASAICLAMPDGRVGALPDAMRPRAGAAGRLADAWRGLALVQAFQRLERRLDGKDRPAHLRAPGQRDRSIPAAAPPAADRLFPWYDPARSAEWEPSSPSRRCSCASSSRSCARRTRSAARVRTARPELVPGDPEASRARNPHAQRLARSRASSMCRSSMASICSRRRARAGPLLLRARSALERRGARVVRASARAGAARASGRRT